MLEKPDFTVPFTHITPYDTYENCRVRVEYFMVSNRPAILFDSENYETLLRANINPDPHHNVPIDCILVKDYSENVGVLATLFQLQIITCVYGYVPLGHTYAPIAKLSRAFLHFIAAQRGS